MERTRSVFIVIYYYYDKLHVKTPQKVTRQDKKKEEKIYAKNER